MIYPIRMYGDPILRKKAFPITEFDKDLKELAADMIETMYNSNGVGLAAPQIGIAIQLFVGLELEVNQEKNQEKKEAEKKYTEEEIQNLTIEEKRQLWGVIAERVMINPQIIKREGIQHGPDGCLSLPGIVVEKMKRDNDITVKYQDLEGNWHEENLEGHFSHVVQHEYDHLQGILYIDRLTKEERGKFIKDNREKLVDMQRHAKAFLKKLRMT